MSDVCAYLSGRTSTHHFENEEMQMFTTDDFLGAELAYRRERLLADRVGRPHHAGPRRRAWLRRDDRAA